MSNEVDNKKFEEMIKEKVKPLESIIRKTDHALGMLKSGYWSIDLIKSSHYKSSMSNISMLGETYREDLLYDLEEYIDNIRNISPEHAEKVRSVLFETINDHKDNYVNEYPYKRPSDGKIIWIFTAGVIEYDGDEAVSVFGVNQDVTDFYKTRTSLIEANKEIEKNQQELIDLFESSLDAIMIVDMKTNMYLTSNHAAKVMYGMPEDVDITKYHVGDFSPEYQENNQRSKEIAKDINERVEKDGGVKTDWIAKRLDGTTFDAQLSMSRAKYDKKDAILVVSRDITDRKKNERQVTQTSQLMSNLILKKNINDKLEIVVQGMQKIFNVEFARLWMLTDDETDDCTKLGEELCDRKGLTCLNIKCAKQGFEKFSDAEDFKNMGKNTLLKVLKGEIEPFFTTQIKEDERIVPNIHSSEVCLQSYAVQLIHYPNGEVAGVMDIYGSNTLNEMDYDRLTGLCNVAGQIISESNAQKELLAVREELEEVYGKSDTALELLNAGYWTIYFKDPGYYISSKRACDILGEEYRDDFRFNLETEWFDRLYAADPEIAMKSQEAFKKSQEPGGPMYDVVYKYRRPKDGRDIWTRAVGSIIRNEDGSPKIMNGVTVDITDQIKAQEELENAKQTAENATKAKSDFLANMSHEIRTPMNAIIGLTRLLEMSDLTFKQRNYVVKTSRAANNLLGIINDILDFSKIEAGKMTIENVEFDLDQILDNVSSVMGIKAFDKGIELVFSKSYELNRMMIGDPLRVEQVLINLVNNAIKFTAKGEVLVKINQVKATKDKMQLEFIVSDTGIGMTEKQVDNLFQAFSQADTSTTRQYGGTGLGLSISKNLVEAMGGSIHVSSKYGKGSTFSFEMTFDLGKRHQLRKLVVPNKLESLKVLVVDDNESAREVMQSYLDGFGIDSRLAKSGEEALEIIDETFDLILMDWKMEGMSGTETWIKIKDKLDNLPKIVIVTAYGKPEIVEEVKNAGVDHILMKPVAQSSLFNVIMEAFNEGVAIEYDLDSKNDLPGMDMIRGARILVAEDNEINQQVIKETLEYEGFLVDIANNGRELCDMYVKDPTYDVILMDLQMPIMSGYEASKLLRDEGYSDIPIIALTADAMHGVRERVEEVGMNDFVAKPIIIKELFTSLLKFIKKEERTFTRGPSINTSNVSLEEGLSRFDLENALERVAHNRKIYLSILEKYIQNYGSFIQDLKQTIKHKDLEKAKRDIHTLKGVSGNIGATKTNELIKKLEQEFLEGKDIVRREVCKELEVSMKKDVNEITRVLASVKNNQSDNDILSKDVVMDKLNILLEQIDNYDAISKQTLAEIAPSLSAMNCTRVDNLKSLLVNYEFEESLEVVKQMIHQLKE